MAIDPSKARTTQPGVEYTDPGAMTTYIVGSAYRIAPLELDRVATTVSAGAVEDITFTLSDDAPSSWFVQASTGVIYGQFDAPGDYEFQVLAVDEGGASAVVESHEFQVFQPPTDFKVNVLATRAEVGPEFTEPSTEVAYVIGVPYKIAPRTR